jgi:type II secretory pathway pseudopilin PulG
MDATFAALLGAVIGGALSVLASWVAQRVQSRTQLLSQEIKRRQQLYSEFVQAASRCYAEALQESEPEPGNLSKLYGEIGRIRLYSSEGVVSEAKFIAHKILETYGDSNRTKSEIRDFLSEGSIDLFSGFGDACRTELANLEPHEAPKLARREAKAASARFMLDDARKLTRLEMPRRVKAKDARRCG